MNTAQKIITLWLAGYVLISFFTAIAVVAYNSYAFWKELPPVTDTARQLGSDYPILWFTWGVSMTAMLFGLIGVLIGALAGHLAWQR